MADYVIAEKAAVISSKNDKGNRSRTRIREGKLYRSDDPIVRGREHLFRPVEDTAQAPGEKRNVRRTRKQAETTAPQPTKAAQPKPAAAKSASSAQNEDSESE